MIRRLIILLLIVGCVFGQNANSDYKYPYTGGATMSYFPTDGNFAISFNMETKNPSLKNISFIGRFGSTPIEGNYEDYTETMGTVNFLEDRDDGHISTGQNHALGVGTVISLKKSMDTGLEILPQMKAFKSIAEVWKEHLTNEPASTLPPNAPTIDEVIDYDGTLYALSDDLRYEYKRGEHKWAKTLMELFEWGSESYSFFVL